MSILQGSQIGVGDSTISVESNLSDDLRALENGHWHLQAVQDIIAVNDDWLLEIANRGSGQIETCLLYTSDAADE